ncbi:MAG: GatB/YqeY domain-containing protein [Minisyncoccia bacterium]
MISTQLIREKMKDAMRAKDALATEVLRGMMAASTNELITLGRKPSDTLSEPELVAVVKRMLKQRKDAAEQFTNGGREDLASKEIAEQKIIEQFLPTQASEAEIEVVVREKIAESGVSDKAGAGKLMGAVIKHFAGNADGSLVKSVVERILAA